MKNSHDHPEAFCLMTYRCEGPGRHEETIWNSRDGVTPFVVDCRICNALAQHIDWQKDQYRPDFVPPQGSRMFIDLTLEAAKKLRQVYVEKWWDNSVRHYGSMKDSGMYASKEDAIEKLALSDFEYGGEPGRSPDLVVAEHPLNLT